MFCLVYLSDLRSRHGLVLLQVVDIQILLEVEVGQLVTLLQAQQALQLGVRADVMLVLQVLLTHVVRDELRHVGAALLAAGGAAQERAQLRGDVRGNLEDAHTGRLALLTLGGRTAAAALVGHLLNASSLLLQALGLRDELAHRLADSQQAGRDGLRLSLQAHLLRHRRRRGSIRHRRRGGHGRRRRHRGGHRRRGSGLGGLGLLGRRLSRHHNGRGGYRGRGSSLLGLLGYLTGSLGRGSGAHNTSSGGRIGGHFTQDLT
jgi:hypothetical protein